LDRLFSDSVGFQKVLTLLSVHASQLLAQAVEAHRDQATRKQICKAPCILPLMVPTIDDLLFYWIF